MPRWIHVDPRAPDASAVDEAANVLRAGGLVALPTETVYGLAARALDARAVSRIFAAKGRPEHHPLIAHVVDEAHARSLAAVWPARAALLASAFWPGPLTLVVDRASHVPPGVAGGGESIAVRVPAHPVALAVIAALGEPVAAPSANRYQGLSPTRAHHVVRQLGEAVDLVVDAGPCEAGIESTVVDARGDRLRVLRPGAVSLGSLRAVAPDVVAHAERLPSQGARVSPGMDARHYAPRARLIVAEGVDAAWAAAARLASEGARVGLVVREGATPGPRERVEVRALPSHVAGYARALYGALHELDEAGVDAIVVQSVPGDEAWWAVADRLGRAGARRGAGG